MLEHESPICGRLWIDLSSNYNFGPSGNRALCGISEAGYKRNDSWKRERIRNDQI